MRRLTIAAGVVAIPTMLLVVLLGVLAAPAAASAPQAPPAQVQAPRPVTGFATDNATCVTCHRNPDLDTRLSNGESLSLHVDPVAFAGSVHGQKNVGCVDCHTDIQSFPHPKLSEPDRRQFTLDLNKTCASCHADKSAKIQDSVHQRAMVAGERRAPVCTDCHGSHAVQRIEEQPRAAIAATCSNCHSTIYGKYKSSVHGAALITENNPDVPTCVDCHGVHNIPDPTTAAFRLRSPTEMCGKCHTDATRMAKYGLSTQVLNTYVSDFHGTTVTLFAKQSPEQQTNKPVCFDCHGVHDISAVKDPQSGLEIKANLLSSCQRCHPEATANFPSSWLSHYIPSPDRTPLVFGVNLFYKILIPTVLGGMGALVALDAGRRLVDHFSG